MDYEERTEAKQKQPREENIDCGGCFPFRLVKKQPARVGGVFQKLGERYKLLGVSQ